MNWPLVAVHSILLNNGNLLVWDGWQQTAADRRCGTRPRRRSRRRSTPRAASSAPATPHLPDGRILIAGGYGDAHHREPRPRRHRHLRPGDVDVEARRRHEQAALVPVAHRARRRPLRRHQRQLDQRDHWADTPEVYDPATNTWTLLTGVSTPQVHEEEYPFSYLAPNGKVFTIGPSEDNSFFLDVDAQTWTPVGGASGVVNGSSVMYRPGKILYSGGGAERHRRADGEGHAAVIDLTAATPDVAHRRPDGTAPASTTR